MLRDDLSSDLDDPLGMLDGAVRRRLRDFLGLILGAVLERHQPSQHPRRVRALAPGSIEERDYLTMVAAGSALAGPCTADRIAGADSSVDRETRRSERVVCFEAVACSGEEFLGLAQVNARLRRSHPTGASGSRQGPHPRFRRVVDPATWFPPARSPARAVGVT
jgi:hypothetical protein